jgi:hypothetical protein
MRVSRKLFQNGWKVLFQHLRWKRLPTLLALVLTAVALVETWRVQWPMLRPIPVQIGFDEAYLAAFADRMIHGRWLPYVDAVSHRGPMLYWATAIGQRLGGPFAWTGIRWLGLLSMIGTIVGCLFAGLASGNPFAGAFAGFFYVYVLAAALDPSSGLEFTGESLAAPFTVASVFAATLGLRMRPSKERLMALGTAGAAASLAALTKQTSALVIVPLAAWTVASLYHESATRNERSIALPCLIAGWFAPIAIVIGRYVMAGETNAFAYWFYVYNHKIYMEPYLGTKLTDELVGLTDEHTLLALAIFVIVVWGTIAPLARKTWWPPRELLRAYASAGFELTVSEQFVVAMVPAILAMRYWPHYFITALPWAGFVIGLALERLLGRVTRLEPAVALGIGTSALAGYLHVSLTKRVAGLKFPREDEPICRAIDIDSTPDESIFIWGFDGDLIVRCRRHAATRFVFSTMVAGIVPPFWHEARPQRIAPGAPVQLVKDLETDQPRLIVDSPLTSVACRSCRFRCSPST